MAASGVCTEFPYPSQSTSISAFRANTWAVIPESQSRYSSLPSSPYFPVLRVSAPLPSAAEGPPPGRPRIPRPALNTFSLFLLSNPSGIYLLTLLNITFPSLSHLSSVDKETWGIAETGLFILKETERTSVPPLNIILFFFTFMIPSCQPWTRALLLPASEHHQEPARSG